MRNAMILAGTLSLALMGGAFAQTSTTTQSPGTTTGTAGTMQPNGTRPTPSAESTAAQTGGRTNESGANATANSGGGGSGSTQGTANSSGGAR